MLKHYILLHSMFKYSKQFCAINNLDEILALIMKWRIKSEVIGSWLYCFTNDLIGAQLISIGFWYSFKHRAFIYSGDEKQGYPDEETLDEIRNRLGSKKLS